MHSGKSILGFFSNCNLRGHLSALEDFFIDQDALIFFEFNIRIGQYSAPIFLFRPNFEKLFAFLKSRKFPKFHMGTFTLKEQSMLIQKFFYGEKLFSGVSKFF
jgi:hypothetical protein